MLARASRLALQRLLPFFKHMPIDAAETLIWRVPFSNVLLDEVIQLQGVPTLPHIPNVQQRDHLAPYYHPLLHSIAVLEEIPLIPKSPYYSEKQAISGTSHEHSKPTARFSRALCSQHAL